ncbi:MAG TPA: glycosyltransferase family 4 protein [Chloroflexota bacterium]|nr:glycosyltransferase family 4 protein [Chloroflexota bacterium]
MGYRVLSIAPTSFFADYGCHVRILEEARALGRLGHDVTVCTYHTGADPAGVRVVRMPGVPWHAEVRVGSHYHKLYFDALLAARALASMGGVDVVHAHLHEGALIGWLVSRVRRVPLVFDYQGSLTREMLDHQFLSESSPLYHVFQWLERTIERLPDLILTSTEHQHAAVSARVTKPVAALPDAVDLDAFGRPDAARVAALRARLGIPPQRQVVAYVGLLAEYQGVGDLIYAARQVVERRPNSHFLIMGYPGIERYTRQAYDLQLLDHVTFTGRVPYGELAEHLALADVAVSAKVSATEGNGKLLNYMAMGLPAVAYDTPVARELLGALGTYAPPGDVTGLGHALQSLLDDADRRRVLGAQLRARAESEFSWDAAGRRLAAHYDDLVRAGARARLNPDARRV